MEIEIQIYPCICEGNEKSLMLEEIKNNHGVVLIDSKSIVVEATKIVDNQFKESKFEEYHTMLDFIPSLITTEQTWTGHLKKRW